MTDFLDGLEQDLVAAARRRAVVPASRRRFWRRGGLRAGVLSLGLFTAAAASAAGGTLYALRGSVIPAPAPADAGPTLTPVANSGRVLDLRAPDPGAGLEWALRLSRTADGLVCTTVGQVDGQRFGLVGLDGRFREVAEGAVDGCGSPRRAATTALGVRVFDAPRRTDVRSVVYVVGGPDLRSATAVTAAGRRRLALDAEHAGLLALPRFPEDQALAVELRYADGHLERRDLGRSPYLAPDPEDGPAYRVVPTAVDQRLVRGPGGRRQPAPGIVTTCVQLVAIRPKGSEHAVSPAACGRITDRRIARGKVRGFFVAIRRLDASVADRTDQTVPARWTIGTRTAIYGQVGQDVRSLRVHRPGRAPSVLLPGVNGAFALVEPGAVDPRTVSVTVRFRDGRERVVDRSTGLVRRRR